jgi:hypothetical protein
VADAVRRGTNPILPVIPIKLMRLMAKAQQRVGKGNPRMEEMEKSEGPKRDEGKNIEEKKPRRRMTRSFRERKMGKKQKEETPPFKNLNIWSLFLVLAI